MSCKVIDRFRGDYSHRGLAAAAASGDLGRQRPAETRGECGQRRLMATAASAGSWRVQPAQAHGDCGQCRLMATAASAGSWRLRPARTHGKCSQRLRTAWTPAVLKFRPRASKKCASATSPRINRGFFLSMAQRMRSYFAVQLTARRTPALGGGAKCSRRAIAQANLAKRMC